MARLLPDSIVQLLSSLMRNQQEKVLPPRTKAMDSRFKKMIFDIILSQNKSEISFLVTLKIVTS